MAIINIEKLTSREYQILFLLSEFKENNEIAEELYISVSTVKANIASILRKLNAYSRTEAVVIGIKRGLLSIENVIPRNRRTK